MIFDVLAFATIFASGAGVDQSFATCGAGRRVTCVVDGDTFWLNRVKYRIADIDAQEMNNPRCAAEKRRAEESTLRLAQLLNADRFGWRRAGRIDTGAL